MTTSQTTRPPGKLKPRTARDTPGRKDHPLEILGALHPLVGLHRSAADLRQTPTVQVLP